MRRRWTPLREQLVRILSGSAAVVVAATWLTVPWSVALGLVGAVLLVIGLVRLPGELRYARGVVRVTRRSRPRPPAGGPRRRPTSQRRRYPVSTALTGPGPVGAPDAVDPIGPGCSGPDTTGSDGGWSDGGSSGGGWSDGGSSGGGDGGGGGGGW